MLAAANMAKERLARQRTNASDNRSPTRNPVCAEDAAAHASLLGGGAVPSHSMAHLGMPPPAVQQQMNPAYGGGGGFGPYAQQHPGFLAHPGYSQPGYPPMPMNATFGSASFANYMAAQQPSPNLPGRAATMGAIYGGGHFPGASGVGVRPGPADAEAGEADEDEEDEEGEDEGPKVEPFVTCKLVCCYLLLLTIGVSFGMIANELHWTDLKNVHPWLEQLETWLHAPHDDPLHGGMYCEDGLFITGPARTGANTLLFLVLLFWSFLGVAIAADVFMAGIEEITSEETEKTLVLPSGEVRRYTITVWNGTIANLTLMALGSSAPEILLSCIEIVGNGFYAGELGPSTIVGSAAFNMLVISAVCVIAIPDGGGRKIKELPVFYITAAFSLVAYLWLIFILVVVTPNRVDVWEGVVTFAFFPLLVYVAYLADIADDAVPGADMDDSPEGADAAAPIGYGKDGRPISKSDVSKVVALKSVSSLHGAEQLQAVASLLLPPQSKAYYRKIATRMALGSSAKADTSNESMRKRIVNAESAMSAASSGKGDVAIVQWAMPAYKCRENEQRVELQVQRLGRLDIACSVQYMSESGTATEGVDFEAARGTVHFRPGQTLATVIVKIIDDDEEEDDETFVVRLHSASGGCQLGLTTACEVTIEDDDGPGELHFVSREVEAPESNESVSVTVMRTHGCQGSVGCHWTTRDGSAKAPHSYTHCKGFLRFDKGVTQQTITVPLSDHGTYHRDDDFQIVLTSASGGARFVTDSTSRKRHAATACVVTVTADPERCATVDQLVAVLDFNASPPPDNIAGGSWAEQFAEAVELPEDGSSLSLVLYFASLPWKLLGAAVPPPAYFGGWLCFVIALVFIGVLTALIGDLASHMGCCMGLKKSVTAITFVALGTSLPDTFASQSAAKSEPYADASIVNVTGSNSVNVFLGLGLPWMAAGVYWWWNGAAQEGLWRRRYAEEPWYTSDTQVGFAVPAGELAYSVSIFCVTSVVCLAVLMLRRRLIGYELGGPSGSKWLTFTLFVGLWLAYIGLSVRHSNSLVASPGA